MMDDTVSDPNGEILMRGEITNSSPSQLQDVTMENSNALSGFRSPPYNTMAYAENSSPSQGRSLREYEEQMGALKKENFNLKLRIYFLEEKNPSMAPAPDGNDSLFKQNVDLKVEIESLRKELQDKQELVCQAAKAMELMEDAQKQSEEIAQAKIDELQKRLTFLEMENETIDKRSQNDFEFGGYSNGANYFTQAENYHVVEQAQQLRINELKTNIDDLERLLRDKDDLISSIKNRLEQLSLENFDLKEKLEESEKNDEIIERAKLTINSITFDNTEKMLSSMLENKNLMSRIDDLTVDLFNEKQVVSVKNDIIQTLTKTIHELKIERSADDDISKYSSCFMEFNNDATFIVPETKENCIQQRISANKKTQQFEKYSPSQLSYEECSLKSLCVDLTPRDDRKLSRMLCNPLFPSAVKYNETIKSPKSDQLSESAIEASSFNLMNKNPSNEENEKTPSVQTMFSVSDLLSRNEQVASRIASELTIRKLSTNNEKIIEKGLEIEVKEDLTKFEDKMLKTEIYEIKQNLADKICCLEETTDKLTEKSSAYDNACLVVNKLSKKIRELETESRLLKSGLDTGTAETFSALLNTTNANADAVEEKNGEILSLNKKIKSMETEIESLKAHLKKKTICLQKIVNKELWEKNREVERLTKFINAQKEMKDEQIAPLSSVAAKRTTEMQLQHSFTEEQYIAAIKENEILQTQLNELIEHLSKSRIIQNSNNKETEKLREELSDANNRALESASYYRKCVGICEVLRLHLEELAEFLNTLLNNKDTQIGTERRRAIKKAIDRSLEVSKNMNASISMNESSMYDDQFSMCFNFQSVTELLDGSTNESFQRIFSGQNELNEIQKKIIEDLQAEIIELKSDPKKKKHGSKERKSLPVIAKHLSESESWSEPDRDVSMARIGLDVDKSQVRQNETSTESDRDENCEKSSRNSIVRLEEMIMEKENKILSAQCALVESDNKLKREKLFNAEKTNQLEIDISNKNKIIDNLKAELEHNAKWAKLLETTKIDLRVAETKLQAVKNDYDDMKMCNKKEIERLRIEYNNLEINKIEIQDNYEKIIRSNELKLKENFVRKIEYENLERELEEVTCKLNTAYDQLSESEELKEKIRNMDINQRKLMKSLDDATLQSSKFVIERTKALGEKSVLEAQIKTLECELIKIKSQKIVSSSESERDDRIYTNSSPDLGIESDVAKTSSIELVNLERKMLRTVEIASGDGDGIDDIKSSHDCARAEKEIIDLKKKLNKTKRALEDTWCQLKRSNLRKEQAEKDIRFQILKTNNILRNVKSNMEESQKIDIGGNEIKREEMLKTTTDEEKEN